MPRQIHEVYEELGQVLESPQAFGLGPQIPPALADRLESMRRMLEQALKELESLPDDEREHYLVADTCRFYATHLSPLHRSMRRPWDPC
jgi:hypothetical protein